MSVTTSKEEAMVWNMEVATLLLSRSGGKDKQVFLWRATWYEETKKLKSIEMVARRMRRWEKFCTNGGYCNRKTHFHSKGLRHATMNSGVTVLPWEPIQGVISRSWSVINGFHMPLKACEKGMMLLLRGIAHGQFYPWPVWD